MFNNAARVTHTYDINIRIKLFITASCKNCSKSGFLIFEIFYVTMFFQDADNFGQVFLCLQSLILI